jgi:hypothetical protein
MTAEMGTAFGAMPSCEPGILDKIEMIKGPGSALYGSDMFYGLISLKTFESESDYRKRRHIFPVRKCRDKNQPGIFR